MRRRQIWQQRAEPVQTKMAEAVQEVMDVAPPQEVKGKQKCTKCGRELVRGIYMHQKYCKGDQT